MRFRFWSWEMRIQSSSFKIWKSLRNSRPSRKFTRSKWTLSTIFSSETRQKIKKTNFRELFLFRTQGITTGITSSFSLRNWARIFRKLSMRMSLRKLILASGFSRKKHGNRNEEKFSIFLIWNLAKIKSNIYLFPLPNKFPLLKSSRFENSRKKKWNTQIK